VLLYLQLETFFKICGCIIVCVWNVYGFQAQSETRPETKRRWRVSRCAGDASTSCKGHSFSLRQGKHVYCVLRCQFFPHSL